jgi:hypothetical protein
MEFRRADRWQRPEARRSGAEVTIPLITDDSSPYLYLWSGSLRSPYLYSSACAKSWRGSSAGSGWHWALRRVGALRLVGAGVHVHDDVDRRGEPTAAAAKALSAAVEDARLAVAGLISKPAFDWGPYRLPRRGDGFPPCSPAKAPSPRRRRVGRNDSATSNARVKAPRAFPPRETRRRPDGVDGAAVRTGDSNPTTRANVRGGRAGVGLSAWWVTSAACCRSRRRCCQVADICGREGR